MDPKILKQKIWELGDPVEYSRDEYVRRMYNILLRRDPDQEGLQRYLSVPNLKLALQEILESEEFHSRFGSAECLAGRSRYPKRALLYGAYGNGNLGDAIQAQSLSRLLNKIDPRLEVWACSMIPGTYPFPYDRVLPTSAAQVPDVINQFDLMVIGGGGLFSHPHPPLNLENWQAALSLPIAIVSVGADTSVIAQNRLLLEKAFYVSARDASSLEAIESIIGTARSSVDPVLGDATLLHRSTKGAADNDGMKRLWILKAPRAQDVPRLRELVDLTRDSVCLLEPGLDYRLITKLPSARAVYSISDLIEVIDQSDVVISMRYHGCILAMLRGVPVVGLYEDKIRQLLDYYGIGKFFRWNFNSFEMPSLDDYKDVRIQIQRDQGILETEIKSMLQSFHREVRIDTA